jgi:hypothetical protein
LAATAAAATTGDSASTTAAAAVDTGSTTGATEMELELLQIAAIFEVCFPALRTTRGPVPISRLAVLGSKRRSKLRTVRSCNYADTHIDQLICLTQLSTLFDPARNFV